MRPMLAESACPRALDTVALGTAEGASMGDALRRGHHGTSQAGEQEQDTSGPTGEDQGRLESMAPAPSHRDWSSNVQRT